MSRDQSRRECAALVAELDLPSPFDLEEMCARIGRRRGKPIALTATPMAMGGGLCGLWMGTATADYVFYEADTSVLHQKHIVFHELGHILRGRASGKILGADVARALAPTVEPGEVQRVLGRDSYTDDDEYEAELIATLILRRLGLGSARETVHATDPAVDDIIGRISHSLTRDER
jgi:hypothetical protein